MTKKIAIFGNSHLASFRLALDRFGDRWTDLQAICVGAHEDMLLDCICKDGILTPATEATRNAFATFGGVASVDLNSFDHVYIAGCDVAFARVAYLYRRARWVDLPSVAASADMTAEEWRLVSRPAFEAMCADMLDATLAGQFATLLRSGSDVPVTIISQPRSGKRLLEDDRSLARLQKSMITSGDAELVSLLFDDICTRHFTDLGFGFIPQPKQARFQHVLTADPFMKGAVRMNPGKPKAQPKTDYLHANATHGRVILDEIART